MSSLRLVRWGEGLLIVGRARYIGHGQVDVTSMFSGKGRRSHGRGRGGCKTSSSCRLQLQEDNKREGWRVWAEKERTEDLRVNSMRKRKNSTKRESPWAGNSTFINSLSTYTRQSCWLIRGWLSAFPVAERQASNQPITKPFTKPCPLYEPDCSHHALRNRHTDSQTQSIKCNTTVSAGL